MKDASPPAAPPLAMLAELTHRCPLSCPYCSNPVELTARQAEMDTAVSPGETEVSVSLDVVFELGK